MRATTTPRRARPERRQRLRPMLAAKSGRLALQPERARSAGPLARGPGPRHTAAPPSLWTPGLALEGQPCSQPPQVEGRLKVLAAERVGARGGARARA
jgi:hypothetical protein